MKKTFYILVIIFCGNFSFTQIVLDRQVIGSTGNLSNTGIIQVFSNVGEAIINTSPKTTLIVTQGFEQPDTIIIDTIIINSVDVSLINISAYPNPTMNELILDFTGTKTTEVVITIFNSTGQIMKNPYLINIQNDCKQKFNFKDFSTGHYFIVVNSTDKKAQKSFKVQKIN